MTRHTLIPSVLLALVSFQIFGGKRLANMHGGGHVFRHVGVFYHRVYFSNIVTSPSTNYRLKIDGSDELLYKEFVEMTSPTDLAGMKFVIERAVTPYVDDQVNSYLPTERRVRRLSAKERADSWVGSEMAFDGSNSKPFFERLTPSS